MVSLLEWNVSGRSGGSEPQKEASEQLPFHRKVLRGRANRVAYPGGGGRRRAGARCPRHDSPPEEALFRFAGVVARQAWRGTGGVPQRTGETACRADPPTDRGQPQSAIGRPVSQSTVAVVGHRDGRFMEPGGVAMDSLLSRPTP
jgi:hypothetical protein